jgi:phage shock protein A
LIPVRIEKEPWVAHGATGRELERFSLTRIAGSARAELARAFGAAPGRVVVRAQTWQNVVAMGIFDRMGRVISSNFNSLLDKATDPGKSVELLIDKMEDELRAARREIVRAVASEKQLKEKVDSLDAEAKKWEARAELALRQNDEALAREALGQKQRVVAERDRAEALRGEQHGAALDMKAELSRMERKLQEFKLRKSTIVAQTQIAQAGGGAEALGRTGGAAGPFDEFRRMEDQIEGVEAAVQAQRELDGVLGQRGPTGMTPAELEAKFRALEAGNEGAKASADVESELSALKQKIRVQG